MRFLNEIDGAAKVKQDNENMFVTSADKANWNAKMTQAEVDARIVSARITDYGYPFREDITIYGESDLYYPVLIRGGNQGIKREIFVRRGYSELAPPDWNTPTHKGDLVLKIKANFGGWGGAKYSWEVHEWEEQYSTIFAGAQNTMSNMAFALFLRGGGTTGARYHLYSDQPLNDTRYIQQLENPIDIPTIGYSSELMIGKSGTYEWFSPPPRTRTAANVKEIEDRKFIKLSQTNATALDALTLEVNKKIAKGKVFTWGDLMGL